MQDIIGKLEVIEIRFQEVGKLITDPDIIADMQRYVKLNKEYKDLEEIVGVYKQYKNSNRQHSQFKRGIGK
jgi:peptide chain release factor 1